MALNYKASALAEVLNAAKDAKPIEGMGDNTYDPENYAKIYNANKAIAEIESGDYLVPQIDTGAFEWDKVNHRLKSIGRYRPAMLDLNVLTMNLYEKTEREREESYTDTEGVTDKDGKTTTKKVTKTRKVKDTVVKVIFGRATVTAIRDMKEIGNAVKAQVFSKSAEEGSDWEYEGAELIKKDDAYNFHNTLDVKSALKLMRLMGESVTNETLEGDSLDNVA